MNQMTWFSALAIIGMLITPQFAHADEAALLNRISVLEKQVGVLVKQLGITEVSTDPSFGEPALPEADQHIQQVMHDTHPWLKGLTLKGDMRLRMENFWVPEAPGRTPRNRFRVRLRYGAEKVLGDDWKVGFRLATGARDTTQSSGTTNDTSIGLPDDPTSTNQTFTDKFNLKDIYLEKAYAIYNPSYFKGLGPIRSAQWGGGKLDQPWAGATTSIVWDGDVTPEGMYEKFEIGVYEGLGENIGAVQDVQLTALAGQWLLGETGSRHGDQEMYSYSAWFDTKVNIGKEKPAVIRNAFNYYDYVDLQDNIAIGSTNLARGNDVTGTKLLVEDWNIVQLYNEIKLPELIMKKDVAVFSDFAFNTEGDIGTGVTTTHIDERNAYSYGLKWGSAKKKGDLELGYQYLRIERNSVPGIFTESDLGNGHADHRGSKFSAAYGLTDNLALNFSAWFVEDLSNQTGTGQVNRFQSDLVWKF